MSIMDVANSFSLAGILDENSRTRDRFPVMEIDVDEIAEHPANSAYSMDPAGIEALAASIKRDGLSDLPLVRRLPDGSFQMLSGHRRRAAYKALAREDPAFSRLPCRVIDGIDDDAAERLLHTANYFTRQLNVLERAAAMRALDVDVAAMRRADPALKGERSQEIKAAILKSQTGRSVSGKTIQRQEATARKIEERLSGSWRDDALRGRVTDTDISRLAELPLERQEDIHRRKTEESLTAREVSELIAQAGLGPADVAKRLRAARREAAKAAELAAAAGVDDESRQLAREVIAVLGQLAGQP